MNRLPIPDMKKIGRIVYLAAIGAVGILLADEWFSFCWPKPAAALSVLAFTALICWSEERAVKPYLWTGIALAVLALLAVMYKSGRDMEPYLLLLGMEAACAFAAVLSCLAEKRFFLRTALILAEVVCLICYGIDGMELPKWTVCIALFAFLMLLTEAAEWKLEKKDGQNAVQLVPVFCCVLLAVSFLPVTETPMQWTAVKKVLSLAKEQMTAVIAEVQFRFRENGGSFSLNFSGYDEDGGLGGSVFSMDQAQLSVKGDQTKSPFYAGGTIFDEYTGTGWTQNEKPGAYQEEEYRFQYEGWKNAFQHSIFTDQEYRELAKIRSCSIKYEGVKTKSLFLAPVTESVTMPDGEKTISQNGGGLALKRAEGIGFCYTTRFLEIDYENEKVKQLLRQQAWSSTPVLDSNAKKRQDEIHAGYTALPNFLPDRIAELAHEITEGAETDYDRMKAIESYLHGYTYSVSVKECPEGMDPLDYFLFESRTGYCTYFATAAALLGRCEGIPTRYVEGFLTNETMEMGGEEIRMTGNNAHAWTEAYIKNIGWVPLEPTPGYGNSDAAAWEHPEAAETVPGEASLEGKPEWDGTKQELEEPAEKALEIGRQLRKGAVICLKILLLISLLAGIVTVFILLRNFMRGRSYQLKNGDEKLREQMRQALYFGKLFGEELRSGETLEAYGKRCGSRLDTPEITFAGFRALFEAVRFGGAAVEQKDLNIAERYVKSLEKQYLEDAGRWKRFLYYLR